MADAVGYSPDEFTFETVKEEAGDQLVFEEIGDNYTGEFTGTETIAFVNKESGEPDSFLQIRFRDPSGPKVINAGYELAKFFTSGDIPVHTIVRLTLANKVDMGKGKNAMLSFRVETATPRNARSQKS
jgi:hypothetical protein